MFGDWIIPIALVGFLLLWLFVLPRIGVRT